MSQVFPLLLSFMSSKYRGILLTLWGIEVTAAPVERLEGSWGAAVVVGDSGRVR